MHNYSDFITSMFNIGCKNQAYPAHYFYKVILTGYNSDQRAYHNLNHIKNMLSVLQEIWTYEKPDTSLVNLDHLIIATFFHDLVYDPLSNKCIDESINLARLCLTDCLITEENIEIICFLVMLTKNHTLVESDIVPTHHQKIFLDADNSILGSEPDKYIKYSREIWTEYSPFYSPDQFRVGRKEFLFNKSTQPKFFFTDYMEKTYREIALINVFREVQELEKWKHP